MRRLAILTLCLIASSDLVHAQEEPARRLNAVEIDLRPLSYALGERGALGVEFSVTYERSLTKADAVKFEAGFGASLATSGLGFNTSVSHGEAMYHYYPRRNSLRGLFLGIGAGHARVILREGIESGANVRTASGDLPFINAEVGDRSIGAFLGEILPGFLPGMTLTSSFGLKQFIGTLAIPQTAIKFPTTYLYLVLSTGYAL